MSPDRTITTPPSPRRARSRGQVAVIFAGAILTFVALCAVVVDISWYWANTLRVQRAADSAALAGAVYLPIDVNTAFSEARAAATRNGYTSGVNGVTVTPTVDDDDPRQLDVRIDGRVNSFFAHALGITGWGVTRVGEGVYIQPVPMGSPDAYYGVGDYYTYVPKIINTPGSDDSGTTEATTSPGTAAWQSPNGSTLVTAVRDNNSNGQNNSPYGFAAATNLVQRWGSFGLTSGLAANQTVTKVNGIRVYLNDMFLSQSCGNNSTNRINVQLSWDGGTNWTTFVTNNDQSTNIGSGTSDDVLGDDNSLTDWAGHTWVPGDLADGKFEVRLTSVRANGCNSQIRLDQLQVQAWYNINTQTTTMELTKSDVKDPNGNILPSRGGWGAMLTRGGNHENGDAYGPANDGGANGEFDPMGYDYIVSLPSGGSVNVFDPGFCAMGQIDAGSIGTGDHWIGTEGTLVSTYYTLWDTGGKPGLRSTWTKVYTSGSLFEKQKGYDPANVNPDQGPPDNATNTCDQFHNKWWTMPVGNLAAGQYAIQVQTSKTSPPSASGDTSINAGTNAENMWALLALGGGSPQIYGNGRMAVYNNLRTNQASQTFYLAQIDKKTGAGKTALLDIFDPGDVAGDAVLKILTPNGGGQSEATFSYTTDGNCDNGVSDACARTNVKQITTANNGASSFNNTWVHISVPLPMSYGSGGLWENGWWQIKYQTPDGGNDTTTWQVNILGNPVHLIVP